MNEGPSNLGLLHNGDATSDANSNQLPATTESDCTLLPLIKR